MLEMIAHTAIPTHDLLLFHAVHAEHLNHTWCTGTVFLSDELAADNKVGHALQCPQLRGLFRAPVERFTPLYGGVCRNTLQAACDMPHRCQSI